MTSNWIRVPINRRHAVRTKRNDKKTARCARVPPTLTYRQQLGVERCGRRKGKILNMFAGSHLEIRKALSRLIPAKPGRRQTAEKPQSNLSIIRLWDSSFISLVYFHWSTHNPAIRLSMDTFTPESLWDIGEVQLYDEWLQWRWQHKRGKAVQCAVGYGKREVA